MTRSRAAAATAATAAAGGGDARAVGLFLCVGQAQADFTGAACACARARARLQLFVIPCGMLFLEWFSARVNATGVLPWRMGIRVDRVLPQPSEVLVQVSFAPGRAPPRASHL